MCSMKAMSAAWFRFLVQAWVLCAGASLPACSKDEPKADRPQRAMDGLERYTAGKVSVETAIDAMEQRDLKKLKMLEVWVRKRDKKVLMTPDDLSALDLAIECLEGQKSPEERRAALDEIQVSQLKAPARDLCIEDDD